MLKNHVQTECSLESVSRSDVHPALLNKMSSSVKKNAACDRWVGKPHELIDSKCFGHTVLFYSTYLLLTKRSSEEWSSYSKNR